MLSASSSAVSAASRCSRNRRNDSSHRRSIWTVLRARFVFVCVMCSRTERETHLLDLTFQPYAFGLYQRDGHCMNGCSWWYIGSPSVSQMYCLPSFSLSFNQCLFSVSYNSRYRIDAFIAFMPLHRCFCLSLTHRDLSFCGYTRRQTIGLY